MNGEGSCAKRDAIERRYEEVENSARADSWDYWHHNIRDYGEAHSGYQGWVGWAPRKEEWVEQQGSKLRKTKQGADSELQGTT